MKRASILCDNYKLERFKEKLTEAGFTDFTWKPFKENITTISLAYQEADLPRLSVLIKLINDSFKN